MNLNRIAVFARVVGAGSSPGAAAALGVRKSSVSRSVAAPGIRFLQRTTRSRSPDAGRAYYDRARDAALMKEFPRASAARHSG